MEPYADNRRARHDYEFLETIEGGLSLTGAETKGVREGKARLAGSYIRPLGGELWLVGAHIGPYSKLSKREGYEPERSRKVLVRRKELLYLLGKTQEKGLTLVPISFYPLGRRIKVSFALARGKKLHDKREKLKERDLMRRVRQRDDE